MTVSNNTVLVSIIIPAYNTGEYIHRAIESSLRQTHENIEVIVVDDGSKDNTLEVAQSYAEKDSRVRVFHKENGGVSSARNLGIREARGEYIVFLDSDDWLEDNAIEYLLDMQMKYPDKLIVGAIYNVIYDEGQKIFFRVSRERNSEILGSVSEIIYAFSSMKFLISVWAKIYKRDIISGYHLKFKEGIHYGEDQLFNFEYINNVKSAFVIGKPLFYILERPYKGIYTEQKENKEDWIPLIASNTQNTPETTRAAKEYYVLVFMIRMLMAFKNKTEHNRVKQFQKKMRLYAREFLSSQRVSLIRKLAFLCMALLPVRLSKLILTVPFYVRTMMKRIKDRNNAEIIPYW